MRFSVPYPWAADLKKSTSCISGRSRPKMASAPPSTGSPKNLYLVSSCLNWV